MSQQNAKLKSIEKIKNPKEKNVFSRILESFLDIHKHRYSRRLFCALILIHMLILLIPVNDLQLILPNDVILLFNYTFKYWPLPTFKMTHQNKIFLSNILYKGFEILVLLLYILDLLPKIFLWKKSVVWKFINAFIVTFMVLQVPFTMIGFLENKSSEKIIKIRLCSISLSFLLLCEILSIREKKNFLRRKEINFFKKENLFTEKKKHEQIQSEYRGYSWIEVVKHDKPGDCWVVIKNKVYDLTNFIDIHPGGPMIYDGAGGDCTSMWYSYHPLSMIKKDPPNKYLIGYVRDYNCFYNYDGEFYDVIKKRVESYLPREKWQNEPIILIKAAIILAIHLISFFKFLYHFNLLWGVIYAISCAQMGVNIMHDGNHMAFTSNKLISLLAGYALDVTGSTSVVYRRSHNFGHHGCVNHFELDTGYDSTYPMFKFHPNQKTMSYHKYQHIYVWIVYGLVNFGDLFGTFDELAGMSNYPTRRGHVTKSAYLLQIFVKGFWFIFFNGVQIYRFGIKDFLPVWFAYMVIFGYGYVLFFAVNHWTTEACIVDNSNISKSNWGELQVENSSNFALGSWFWTNLVGGLNYQIEHHLFPQICHTRLPEISHIVKKTCLEYNIRYYSFPTFWSAMYGHYTLLKKLSQD